MELSRSGVARLAWVVLTAAVGLAAMRENSEFWLGAAWRRSPRPG